MGMDSNTNNRPSLTLFLFFFLAFLAEILSIFLEVHDMGTNLSNDGYKWEKRVNNTE